MKDHAYFNPFIAAYNLAEHHNRPHPEGRMRVVFLVQNVLIWDKQAPVYDVLAEDETVETIIVLLPSYSSTDNEAEKPVGTYEEEYWHFFHDHYANVYDFTNVLDLRIFQPDYIFMALPYEGLRPLRGTHTAELAKIAKLCYIAYGTQGTKSFIQIEAGLSDFFSHMTFHFCDSAEEKAAMEIVYPVTAAAGVQHFEDLGYPGFESYLEAQNERRVIRRVLWTPRWNTEKRIGGSHFFDYKDDFLAFAGKYGGAGIQFAIRPHPLMFDHFVQKGQMTEQEVADYKEQLAVCGVELDEGRYDAFEALGLADILLTDFSSLNMPFFLLNRPLVYCPNDSELTDDYKQMLEGSYVAQNWEEASFHLERLLRGEDPAAHRRREIVAAFCEKHRGAARRIANRLKKDYADSRNPEAVHMPELDRWIFDQKKGLVSLLAGRRTDLLARFCEQEWYEGYLALLSVHVQSENLIWGEQQLLAKLQEMYISAENDERRACLTLAMLLFADPLTLPLPLAVDLWPKGLYQDIREVFDQQRRAVGLI